MTTLVQHTGGNLSWGRNRLVAACRTPFLLLLEDDFEFNAETNLAALVEVLSHDDELAGVGGMLLEQGRRRAWCHNFERFRGRALLHPSELPWRCTSSGLAYRPCQALLNFGLFRRQVMAELPWDEQLPLTEHRDWYWRLSQTGQWRVALAPTVEILHHRDRPPEYIPDRRRSFQHRVFNKHGLRFSSPRELDWNAARPNLVVLGVGHANTTITTRQLSALGWNLGDADEPFAESVSVRELNQRLIRGDEFDQRAATAALRQLSVPWVLKDPRFAETLTNWLPVFLPHRPILVWINKDRAEVERSYMRRGVPESRAAAIVADREQACRRHFAHWPWGKLQIDAAQIRAAVSMFDVSR